MQWLDIYDTALNKLARVYTWQSIVWENCYNTAGSIEIAMYPDAELIPLFARGNYIKWSEADNPGIIGSVQIDNEKMTVYGKDAVWLLDLRCCQASYGRGNAETIMLGLVDTYCNDLPCVSTASSGLTVRYNHQTSDKSILGMLEKISADTDVGFRMRINNGNLVVSCYQPDTNVNAVFGTAYGNLVSVEYIHSIMDYKNVAIVAGEATSSGRTTVTVGDTTATGLNRRELYVDARDQQKEDDETDAEYLARLESRGWDKLADQTEIETIECDLTASDVQLGEVVKVVLPELGSLTVQARITSITTTNEDGVTTRTASIGSTIK